MIKANLIKTLSDLSPWINIEEMRIKEQEGLFLYIDFISYVLKNQANFSDLLSKIDNKVDESLLSEN